MVTKENLENILKYYQEENIKSWTKKDVSYHNSIRALGVLEGILFERGKFEPDGKFHYKDIEAIEIGWFGKKRKVIRKQKYSEFIVEKTQELINEL